MPKYYYNQLIRKRLAWIPLYQKTKNVSFICRHFGIARKTFYKWLSRYNRSGQDPSSLIDKPRRPKQAPKETPQQIQMLIVKLRKETQFGPDRLNFFLLKDHRIAIPRSTIYVILKRKGLIKKTPRRIKKPLLYQMPSPGYIQMDIKMIGGYRANRFVQYSAQDDATRMKFTRLYKERSTSNTLNFLRHIAGRFPWNSAMMIEKTETWIIC